MWKFVCTSTFSRSILKYSTFNGGLTYICTQHVALYCIAEFREVMETVIMWVTAGKPSLVDAGISCRETERRMARIGLSMQTAKAYFCLPRTYRSYQRYPRARKKIPIAGIHYRCHAVQRQHREEKENRSLPSSRVNPVKIDDLAIQAFLKISMMQPNPPLFYREWQ